MEQTYYFKLKLQGTVRNPVLNIVPTAYVKKSAPYPINFAELNVPILVNDSTVTDSFDLEYSLDFERSLNGYGEKQDLFKRKNLMRVLHDLETTIDKGLREVLCFESKLKSRVKVVSDNGLKTYKTGRLGKPPRHTRVYQTRKNLSP
ncbi:MAG: hypothetical protein PHH54_05825 [Candidatus Nanoarchaeia archaeon]|nr:hypothetical protein [Candidatus Nanoarchaeia archaeon]MDD5741474.1 hypothetical protein [Candidatus Nanoarchaeia archaeon]